MPAGWDVSVVGTEVLFDFLNPKFTTYKTRTITMITHATNIDASVKNVLFLLFGVTALFVWVGKLGSISHYCCYEASLSSSSGSSFLFTNIPFSKNWVLSFMHIVCGILFISRKFINL